MNGSAINQPSTLFPPPSDPLQIEWLVTEIIIFPLPKGIIWNSSFNMHVEATKNYNIVEDSVQSPSLVSVLEVPQTYVV